MKKILITAHALKILICFLKSFDATCLLVAEIASLCVGGMHKMTGISLGGGKSNAN